MSLKNGEMCIQIYKQCASGHRPQFIAYAMALQYWFTFIYSIIVSPEVARFGEKLYKVKGGLPYSSSTEGPIVSAVKSLFCIRCKH